MKIEQASGPTGPQQNYCPGRGPGGPKDGRPYCYNLICSGGSCQLSVVDYDSMP